MESMCIASHETTHFLFHRYYSSIEDYIKKHMLELRDDDGCTAYSADWWGAAKNGGSFTAAINETLAEISACEYNSLRQSHPPTKVWKDLHTLLLKSNKDWLKQSEKYKKQDDRSKIWIWNPDSPNTEKWEFVQEVKTSQVEKWLKLLRDKNPKSIYTSTKSGWGRPSKEEYKRLAK